MDGFLSKVFSFLNKVFEPKPEVRQVNFLVEDDQAPANGSNPVFVQKNRSWCLLLDSTSLVEKVESSQKKEAPR